MERVIFRKWANGGIIALFPDLPWNDQGDITSYETVGQHGAAGYNCVVSCTKPAKPNEYRKLKQELTSLGYSLKVITRNYRK